MLIVGKCKSHAMPLFACIRGMDTCGSNRIVFRSCTGWGNNPMVRFRPTGEKKKGDGATVAPRTVGHCIIDCSSAILKGILEIFFTFWEFTFQGKSMGKCRGNPTPLFKLGSPIPICPPGPLWLLGISDVGEVIAKTPRTAAFFRASIAVVALQLGE